MIQKPTKKIKDAEAAMDKAKLKVEKAK